MANELKHCPFCGSPAELTHTKTWDYYVRCTNKPCAARTRQYHENDVGAVNAWNTRAATTIGQVAVEVVPTKRTCTMLRLTDYTCQYMHRYACSECGEFNEQPTVMGKSEPPRYCPSCGACVGEVDA